MHPVPRGLGVPGRNPPKNLPPPQGPPPCQISSRSIQGFGFLKRTNTHTDIALYVLDNHLFVEPKQQLSLVSNLGTLNEFLLAILGLYFVCFRSFQPNNKFRWKNVHPVSSAKIRTHETPPLTTRQQLDEVVSD